MNSILEEKPDNVSILSYAEENTNHTLNEVADALSTFFEENMDSILKEEPILNEMLTSVEANTKSTEEEKQKVRKKKKKKFRKSKVWKKVQYIGFPSISVFCAFFVMFIWMINRNDSNKAKETNVVKNETGSGSNSCPFWELAGDGYCDDETNIPECGYDYNDCCLLENDRSLCTNCTCHLSEDEVQLFQSQSCFNHFNHYVTNRLGDSICDLDLNQAKYYFDVGDCCRDFHEFEKMTCKFKEHLVKCPPDPCIRSNNFCIAEELGDGICQDHNNGPYCDYDLGDCCSKDKHIFGPNNPKDCCGCFCHPVHHDNHIFYFG